MWYVDGMTEKPRTTAIDLLSNNGSKRLNVAIEQIAKEIEKAKGELVLLEYERAMLDRAVAQAIARENEPNGRVSREDVLSALSSRPTGITPTELAAQFSKDGAEFTKQAAHNHLTRLVESGLAITDGNGNYALSSTSNDSSQKQPTRS